MKRIAAVLVCGFLIIVGSSTVAVAAPARPGGPCVQIGKVVKVGSVTLKCVKKRGKLVWQRVTPANPAPPVQPDPLPAVLTLQAAFERSGLRVSWDGAASLGRPDFSAFIVDVTSPLAPGRKVLRNTREQEFFLTIDDFLWGFGARVTTVEVTVTPVNANGVRGLPSTVTAVNDPPKAPTGALATSQNMGFEVSWNVSDQPDDFAALVVYVSASVDGPYRSRSAEHSSPAFIPATSFSPTYVKVAYMDSMTQMSEMAGPWLVTPRNPVVVSGR